LVELSVGPAYIDVEAEITFTFDVRFEVCHFEVVVHPVHYEVWEPRVFAASLEEFVKKL